MIKLISLRDAITAAFPELQANPDALLVFADNGHVVATTGPTHSFEYRYTANLIATDFAGNADLLMLTVLAWAREHQRELLEHPGMRPTAIAFDVEQLTNATCDVSLKLSLTEKVKVGKDGEGKPTFEHVPETVPEWEHVGTLYVDP